MMDLEQITDKEKEALHIACVSESDLTIRGKWKTLEIMKYNDGDVELEIEDGNERIVYVFDKGQIDFLIKWLAHSR
jgi:hypothetical protein